MPHALNFLHGHHTPRCIATVNKHFTYHTLQFKTRGQVELFYDDHRTLMPGVWLWPCHPGPHVRFHEYPRGAPWEHRYVAFTGPLIADWKSAGLWPEEPQKIESRARTTRFIRWFDELLQMKQQPGRWSQQTAVNLLERILLDLAQHRQTESTPKAPAWLAPVVDRLATFSGDEPDYAELADEFHVALPTFRRHFRAVTGSSLHDYRLDCRIAQAKDALGNSATPIKSIADQLGYRDVFYFTRQFHQRTGVSPAAYRKSRQG